MLISHKEAEDSLDKLGQAALLLFCIAAILAA